MQQAGLVAQETMVDSIIYMQKMRDNRSPRRPCLDPIIDLPARFPSLKLTRSGVLHSGTHMDKVIPVSVSEVNGASRQQSQE